MRLEDRPPHQGDALYYSYIFHSLFGGAIPLEREGTLLGRQTHTAEGLYYLGGILWGRDLGG